jgi:hypothetical protein
VGSSFSGSTVLGALLGLHPDGICAGELGTWTQRTESQDLLCSCGVIRHDCSFWSQVEATWLGQNHPGWLRYRVIQHRFEQLRGVPFLNLQRLLYREEFETYADVTRGLYQSLYKVSGKEIIFDISKRVGRAQALNRIAGLEVYYIHLVRDGRGYVVSSLKPKRKWAQTENPKKPSVGFLVWTSLEWVFTNRLAEKIIADSHRPSLRLRYEDLAVDPATALDRISTAFAIDLSSVQDYLESGKLINFGHMGEGNRIRLTGPTALRLDESWKQALPLYAARLFWVLAGATSRRYGYSQPGLIFP